MSARPDTCCCCVKQSPAVAAACAAAAEHEYTDANLGFQHLKGTDRGMARTLATCPGLDAHVVLVTRTVSGGAEWSGRCGWKRRRWYEDSSEEEEDEGGHHDMTEVDH